MQSRPLFTFVLLVAMLSGLGACRSLPPSSDVATTFRERLAPKNRAELQRDWRLSLNQPVTWVPKGVAVPSKDYPCVENGWRAPIYARTDDRLHRFYVPADDQQVARWTSAQRLIADYQKPSPAGSVAQAVGNTALVLLKTALYAGAMAAH